MDMQTIIDNWSAAERAKRSETQMTLQDLIHALEAMPAGAQVANLNTPDSYRGYYADLAFSRGAGMRPAFELLADCKAALGAEFEGYKGGEFVMGKTTPLWVAEYGVIGQKLISLGVEGAIETADDD